MQGPSSAGILGLRNNIVCMSWETLTRLTGKTRTYTRTQYRTLKLEQRSHAAREGANGCAVRPSVRPTGDPGRRIRSQ